MSLEGISGSAVSGVSEVEFSRRGHRVGPEGLKAGTERRGKEKIIASYDCDGALPGSRITDKVMCLAVL